MMMFEMKKNGLGNFSGLNMIIARFETMFHVIAFRKIA